MPSYMLLLLLTLLTTPLLADYPVEVLRLNNHSGEEVIPLIKPYIESDGSVASLEGKLIVRTSSEKMAQIKKILSDIDRQPRRLMIYVRQTSGGMPGGNRRKTGAGANPGRIVGLPGDSGQVRSDKIVGLPSGNSATASAGLHVGTQSDQDQTLRVQAVEGKPAFIETGTQVAIRDGAVGVGPFGFGAAVNTRYKNATTGFYALAKTDGNRVTVEISAQQMQQGRVNEQFDTGRGSTTVSGNIGDWITLGGTSRGGFNNRKAGGISAATTNNNDRDTYLKVEALD